MNAAEIDAIAASLHVLRPDWPSGQIRTLIRDNLAERPRRDVLVALTWVAGDTDSHTPYRVLENGPWWKAAAADRTRAPVEHTDPGRLCSTCSLPEAECRRRWADDHDYLSTEDHQAQVDAMDPLVREMRMRDLRAAVQGFGRIPDA